MRRNSLSVYSVLTGASPTRRCVGCSFRGMTGRSSSSFPKLGESMRSLKLLSTGFAVLAAALAVTSVPRVARAGDAGCGNFSGKNCTTTHQCTQWVGTTCLSYYDSVAYYPAAS
jgi:hypothetical protein